jgi:hypothetical protein
VFPFPSTPLPLHRDHFLFRAQVDPSVGHKGVMLKTRYSLKHDIAHGGSFVGGVAVPFCNLGRDSQASEGACLVYRSLSVRFCTYSDKNPVTLCSKTVLKKGFLTLRSKHKGTIYEFTIILGMFIVM